ncbi:MAG: Uma2 family endonuclease [Ktedonobacteraceae bacterium]
MDTLRWTVDDVEPLPDDGSRYEIIDGELYVSELPDVYHQIVCTHVATYIELWNDQIRSGLTILAPGIIFTNDNAVVPDVVWISNERYAAALQADGKIHSCPELVIEILSPGPENRRRDRETKRKLYSRRGAEEYWIVNWQERRLEVYQRENAVLTLDRTLAENDVLETALLPGFRCKIGEFFTNILTHHSRNELGKRGIFWHTEEHERRASNYNRAYR